MPQMKDFPDWVKTAFPDPEGAWDGLEMHLLAGPAGQAVFLRATRDLVVPEHSHLEQWGVVISGELEFTIGGVKRMLGPGDTYSIKAGEPHSAFLKEGCCAIDVFNQPDRFAPKSRK